MKKCNDCNKEILDPNFNCEECLKDLAGAYNKICPVCKKLHTISILDSNGHWHCNICGELYYKQNSRNKIEKLLSNNEAREIIKKYVKNKFLKEHIAIDISPNIIEQIFREQGIIK